MNFTYSFPAVRGIQAQKEYYITMIPLKYLVRILPEPTEYVPPEYRAQRKLNEVRIPEIKNYILDNRDNYIFSSLTASIDGEYTFLPNQDMKDMGILNISMEAKILINDGQHRRAAIAQALLEDETLGDETISVVLFEDQGLSRSQQMFTDLNMNAQKSSNSINTCFETRAPLAVLTKKVVSEINFLNKYTDLERDNLGKNSSKLFTLHTIYKSNKIIFNNTDIEDKDKRFLKDFWSAVVKYMPEWNLLENKKISKQELREEYVTILGVTIQSLGIIGKWLYDKNVNLDEYLSKLANIDWNRHNKNWLKRIIREDGKIITNQRAILLASNYIKMQIGIELSSEEQKREEMIR